MWGSTYLAIRVLVERVPPLLGAGARFAVSGALLAVFVALHRTSRFHVERAEAAGAVGISVLTLFGAFSLLFLGETRVPSGLAALLIASMPLWVVVLRLLARERLPAPLLAAVALGFAGVAITVLLRRRRTGRVDVQSVTPTMLVGVALITVAVATVVRRELPGQVLRPPSSHTGRQRR